MSAGIPSDHKIASKNLLLFVQHLVYSCLLKFLLVSSIFALEAIASYLHKNFIFFKNSLSINNTYQSCRVRNDYPSFSLNTLQITKLYAIQYR